MRNADELWELRRENKTRLQQLCGNMETEGFHLGRAPYAVFQSDHSVTKIS